MGRSNGKMDGSSVNINRFPIHTMKNDSCVVVVGRRGSGKSTCLKSILKSKKHLPYCVILTGTHKAAQEYREHTNLVYVGYNIEIIKSIIEFQRAAFHRGEMQNMVVVLDDLMFKKSIFSDDEIRFMFYNGRQLGIFFVLALQYVYGIGPNQRSQVDTIFAALEKVKDNRERVYKSFNPCMDTFSEFDQVMRACTTDYSMLVIQQAQTRSEEIGDNVFWHKAELHPVFRIGDRGSVELEKFISLRVDAKNLKASRKLIVNKIDSGMTFPSLAMHKQNVRKRPVNFTPLRFGSSKRRRKSGTTKRKRKLKRRTRLNHYGGLKRQRPTRIMRFTRPAPQKVSRDVVALWAGQKKYTIPEFDRRCFRNSIRY